MKTLSSSLRGLLLDRNFVYFGTINPDGTPHVTPMWVDTDGSHVVVNTAIGRRKVRNLERDPRVSLVVSHAGDPYRYTMVTGEVVVRTAGAAAEKHIDKLSMKYDRKHWKPVRGQRRIILKVRVDKVGSFG